MKYFNIKILSLPLLLVGFFSVEMLAQKPPDCLKAAKITRPTFVLVSPAKLNKFADGEADFSKMKIVKSELAYYLLASEQGGTRIFAFELEQQGKRLFLNQKLPVQTCSEGELSLDTFLQEDGKITGCRMGNHTIRQRQ